MKAKQWLSIHETLFFTVTVGAINNCSLVFSLIAVEEISKKRFFWHKIVSQASTRLLKRTANIP